MQGYGLGLISTEALGWIGLIVFAASVIAGWISDSLMRHLGFGIVGNTILSFLGISAGLLGWNVGIRPLIATDPFLLVSAGAASAFGMVLLMATVKRTLA